MTRSRHARGSRRGESDGTQPRLRNRRAASLAAWSAAAFLAGAAVAQPVETEAPALPPLALLEQRGATIGRVNITVQNVFDPSNPEEDKALYRWANRVHVKTRETVIEDILLVAPGDSFQARLLDESARLLRTFGFLADAGVSVAAYDEATNTVDVNVWVRDSWSLAPDLKFGRSGGENEVGIGVADSNLFGTGKDLTVSYRKDVDRSETLLAYGDRNVFGSRVRLAASLANASDGHRRAITAERPFFAFDTRWALGGSLHDERRVDPMYHLGEIVDEFEHEIRALNLQGGRSRGYIDGLTRRWLAGVSFEEHRFRPSADVPQPLLLPEDRKFVYPWLGFELVRDDFREMRELNDMGRTEDVSLGLNFSASLGYSSDAFGGDRDAWLFRARALKGWEPGGPGRLLLFEATAAARSEDGELTNSRVAAAARYYRRNLGRHLFTARLGAVASNRLDADNQVLLGGDNGLRGYPLRYQAGEHFAVLTLEQRFFTDWYPARLFRVGYAAFMDVGRVWGQDPRGTPSLGTLYDVGVGLRLTSPRSSGRSVLHIDLAFPLDGDPSIDKVQLLLETKSSF